MSTNEKFEVIVDENMRADLIELVHARPVLWNMGLPEYSRISNKDKGKLWAEIAKELNSDGMYCCISQFNVIICRT